MCIGINNSRIQDNQTRIKIISDWLNLQNLIQIRKYDKLYFLRAKRGLSSLGNLKISNTNSISEFVVIGRMCACGLKFPPLVGGNLLEVTCWR